MLILVNFFYNVADFARKIASVQSDHHKVLNLLRGFDFWLKVSIFIKNKTYHHLIAVCAICCWLI
jgi:hypothetical protein